MLTYCPKQGIAPVRSELGPFVTTAGEPHPCKGDDMQHRPLRVLVMGRRHGTTDDLSRMLSLGGYNADFRLATDVDDARPAVSRNGIDLIIGEDQTSLRQFIRNLPPGVPFIAVDADISHERGRALIEAGAHDYMARREMERLPASVTRAMRDVRPKRVPAPVTDGNAPQPAAHTLPHGAENPAQPSAPSAGDHSPEPQHCEHSANTFAELYRHSLDAVVILNLDEHVLDINAAFTKTFGYSADEVRGRHLGDCILPEGADEEFLSLTSRVREGHMVRKRTTRLRKDGSSVDVIAVGIPVELEDGARGICAIYSDISPREKAIRTLRQAESRYRNFFMKAVEGMFVSTPSGRFMLANPALAEMLGYESISEVTDEIRSLSREVYAEPSERDKLLDALREHGSVMNLRTRMRRADGTTLTVRQNVREIRDDDGELLYFQGTMTPEPDPGDI